MGISVFMFCPECRVFMPLGHRDPMLECDVDGEEDWGEGGFSASRQDVLQVFLGQEDFFSPSNAYEVALRRLVQQFVANHADHDEDRKVYFANNYGNYMWEPGTGYLQSSWWRYEELVVMDEQLPNQVPPHVWTFLPSHIVKHAGYTSFDEALNYLISQQRPADSLAQARELPYFRCFYQGVLKWRTDPVAGGKSLPPEPPHLSNLLEHCLKALSTAKSEQLTPLNAIQMPCNLAQKVWEALAQCDSTERERLESEDTSFEEEAGKRFRALDDMFARSLDQLVITPATLDVFDNDQALNGHILRMIARPDCALRELEVILADNVWEEDYSSGSYRELNSCSLGALRTLTMVLLRCLRGPRIERLSLTACGALTDEFLLPLDAPLKGRFVSESLDEADTQKEGGLRKMTLADEDQILARSLMQRLTESTDANQRLRGTYDALVELDVSNCHRLTDRITLHLHDMFPRLARLHLNDLNFLPFHSMPSGAPPQLEHLVELNMAASYYEHEQKRDAAYFERLAAVCPLLESLNVAFWDITDAELDQITHGFPRLCRLNLIGSGAGLTNAGLEALGRRLVERDRHMDQIKVGTCVGLTSLGGLERVRCIKAVGALLGSQPLFPGGGGGGEKELQLDVEELDLTAVSDLSDERFLQAMAMVQKSLKRININGCYKLHRATVMQAVKDFPHIHIVTGGTYQDSWQ